MIYYFLMKIYYVVKLCETQKCTRSNYGSHSSVMETNHELVIKRFRMPSTRCELPKRFFEIVYDSFFDRFCREKCNGRRDDMSSFRFVMLKLGYIE